MQSLQHPIEPPGRCDVSDKAEGAPMDLRSIVLAVLKAKAGHAFTFDEVVKGVAERLESDVRDTLNDLARKERIQRHIDGRDHPWRYQAF